MNCKKVVVLLLLHLSCNNVEKKTVNDEISHQEITKHKEERENFDNFFSKFRSDSSFRLSRTKFPLYGYNSDEKKIDSRDTLYV